MLGLSFGAFTFLHVMLSIAGIVAGLYVVGGLASGKRLDGWIGVFLVTTLLTNITGFLFPFRVLMPSHILGGISLVVIPVCMYALYGKRLEGSWRKIFVITAVTALYFNVFVLMAQLFAKVPGLIVISPTQQSPAFGATQLVLLVVFVVMGRAARRGFAS
jgi:hypothetical protein